ncbi:hypothetical protein CK203_089682 [Vitis vinifera]|uniref:Uncharacterized protein n=1 Tax=Vitis vinifera TaxID=29760 RepID=A0A438EI61_VITVI|nr:hypothetical protein CK203_089682 [Vitis vinifera]
MNVEQMKMKKNVIPKKVMIKVRERKMFNMMTMRCSNLLMRKKIMLMLFQSFLALHEAMKSEQGRYVSVNGEGCDMSNDLDHEDPIEFSHVQYHSTPSLQFENVENIDRHSGIMAAMTMFILVGMSHTHIIRAALATKIENFNKHMNTIGRINAVAQQWLEAIPFEK